MTLFLDLLILFVGILIVLFLVTQIIAPTLSGEPLFPFFKLSRTRMKIEEANRALEETAEQEHLQKVETELNRRKAELEKK